MTDIHDVVTQIATRADGAGVQIAVAESLTSGRIAAALGAGDNASAWFRGGVVAYHSEVKFEVLGVDPGPVMTARCAEQMARGVGDLLGADLCAGVTGVGGPDSEEGQPAGTVFVATMVRGRLSTSQHIFEGDPPDVLDATVSVTLQQLLDTLRQQP